MIEFRRIWDQLRAQKPHRNNFLEEVRIQGFRGIRDLRVSFDYPVTVLAGPNACGKSTVLFSLALAYKKPNTEVFWYKPSRIFPDFKKINSVLPADEKKEFSLTFNYLHNDERFSMQWKMGKGGWSRNFMGKKGCETPKLNLYLRTLSRLSNPTELKSGFLLGKDFRQESINATDISFAQSILQFKYKEIKRIIKGRSKNDLLFVERELGEATTKYSEFHMSCGESALLRLANDLSKFDNGLVLIDEIEASLHPYSQQFLMLELQRIALRQNLQIIVATHSPIILDTVPNDARKFLEREENNVIIQYLYRDLIQKTFYGFTSETLNILCEDEISEGLLLGIFDYLNQKLMIEPGDIKIGRNTGKDEFPAHIKALAKFNKIRDFIFVLDGDARKDENRLRVIAEERGQYARILYLPSNTNPEEWAFKILSDNTKCYSEKLGISEEILLKKITDANYIYSLATDTESNKAKEKIKWIAQNLKRETANILRIIGQFEAQEKNAEIADLLKGLEESINQWRLLKE